MDFHSLSQAPLSKVKRPDFSASAKNRAKYSVSSSVADAVISFSVSPSKIFSLPFFSFLFKGYSIFTNFGTFL